MSRGVKTQLSSPSPTYFVVRFFPGLQELGEIYSLACDSEHLITGHTLNTSAFKVWRTRDFEEVKIIKVRLQFLIKMRSKRNSTLQE